MKGANNIQFVSLRKIKTKVSLNIKNLKSPIESWKFFVKLRRRGKSISDKFQICLLLQTACYINMIIWFFVSLQNVIFPPLYVQIFGMANIKLDLICNWKNKWLSIYFPWNFKGYVQHM